MLSQNTGCGLALGRSCSIWALVPQLVGSFCTAEMGPSRGGAEFLRDSKHPGRLADALGSVSPLPKPLLGCSTLVCSDPPQVHHGAKRRHCYPSSWKRWVFYLLPGITLAFIAISVYAFMETNENYYYTHSIWHVLVACSVAFLLPPRDKHKKPWAWSQKLTCRYQICQNDREELYAVT